MAVRLLRPMISAADDLPTIGHEGVRFLGVRVEPNENFDVDVDRQTGMVVLNGKGVSVTPDDVRKLPNVRRPKSLGGRGKDPVFSLAVTDIPDGLKYVEDSDSHGALAPTRAMNVEQYRKLVESTRNKWKRHDLDELLRDLPRPSK